MKTLEEQFYEYGVIPVVVLERAEDALPLAKALVEGGLPCAEVTFRTEAAEAAIRQMRREYPGMLVGAGTILSVEQAYRAAAAGAKFIVSPGFDPEVVDYCRERGIPVCPGCVTPSEIAQAVKRGIQAVKFFPAEQNGGIAALRCLAEPYRMLKFMPTGGINAANLEEYLRFDRILCCGGSWIVREKMIRNGEFDKIQGLAREAVELAASVRRQAKSPEQNENGGE